MLAFEAGPVFGYPSQTLSNKMLIANGANIGNVLGQVFFGFFGDLMGRKWSFVATSCLIIFGACLSASAGTVGGSDVYTQLFIWRFILGFGVGGVFVVMLCAHMCNIRASSRGRLSSAAALSPVLELNQYLLLLLRTCEGEYPLSATISSEGSTFKNRGKAVSTVFSFQGWGKVRLVA